MRPNAVLRHSAAFADERIAVPKDGALEGFAWAVVLVSLGALMLL